MMGALKGLVVDNMDPLKIGRLRIRVPVLHGASPADPSYMADSSIPWSYPVIPWYGAYDCGSFIVPPVGAYLWVIQTEGDNPTFVYLGGSYGIGSTVPKMMNTTDPSNSSNKSMGQWFAPAGKLEIPTESQESYTESGVIFKSPKGHTICYSDKDDGEYFKIIDRDGQSIEFICPVSKEDNVGNKSKRVKGSSISGGKLKIHSTGDIVISSDDSITISSNKINIQGNISTSISGGSEGRTYS